MKSIKWMGDITFIQFRSCSFPSTSVFSASVHGDFESMSLRFVKNGEEVGRPAWHPFYVYHARFSKTLLVQKWP